MLCFVPYNIVSQASVYIDELTMGAVLYNVLRECCLDVANFLTSGPAGAILSFGVQNTRLVLTVTGDRLSIVASGSPLLPNIVRQPGDDEGMLDVIGGLIGDAIQSLVISASATLLFPGQIDTELKIALPAIPDLLMVDTDGVSGPAIFARTQFVFGGSGLKLSYGLRLPLRICLEDCDTGAPYYAHLVGELALVFTPTAQQISGLLVWDGFWYNAFGLPFLHIGNIIIGLDVDLKVFLPSGAQFGAAVCVGREVNCRPPRAGGPFIDVRIYMGISATIPEDNYFIFMISSLTFGTLVDLLVDYLPIPQSVFDNIPARLLESGIYPFEPNLPGCSGGQPSNTSGSNAVDLRCYAYFSYSPLVEKTITFSQGSVVIPRGIQVAGRLNFGGWEMALKLAISTTEFKVNATLDPVNIDILGLKLNLGRDLDSNKKAIGGGQFIVELSKVRVLVSVNAAFDLPLLKSYGQITLEINKEEFFFETEISLFDGALQSFVQVRWAWDLSFFRMELADISFPPLVPLVKVESFVFEMQLNKAFALFDCKITVFGFIGITATLQVDNNVVDFYLEINLQLAKTIVEGNAVVATPFSDSQFSISVRVEAGQLLQDIANAIAGAVRAVAQYLGGLWSKITDKFNARVAVCREKVNNELRDIKGAWDSLIDGPGAGFQNLDAFLEAPAVIAQSLGALIEIGIEFVGGLIVDVANVIADAFKDLGNAIADFLNDLFCDTEVTDIEDKTSGGIGKWGCPRWRVGKKVCQPNPSPPPPPAVQYSTVQYRTVQHSTAQYSTVQYSTVQYSTVQYSTVQYSTVQYSTVQYSTVQYSTVQSVKHNPGQHTQPEHYFCNIYFYMCMFVVCVAG